MPTAEALDQAEQEETERLRREAERREHARKLRAAVSYQTRHIDPFGVLLDDENGPKAGDEILKRLAGFGVDVDRRSFGQREAGQMLHQLIKRSRAGPCTYKQARVLARAGLSTKVSKREASRIIDELKRNGWRPTRALREEYGATA